MGIQQSFITEWDNTEKTVEPFGRVVTRETVEAYYNAMCQHKIPPLEDFNWACLQAANHFKKLPNWVEVDPAPGDRIIFVGDLHGCFETIIRMFSGHEATGVKPIGFPGPQSDGRRNIYLFNGDLIDRGGSAYQIVFTICLYTLLYPNCVYVNRGNHESELFGLSTQAGMGHKFMFEIQQKFPQSDFSKFKPAVQELFLSLPICHSFDRNIFVVHGGVPMASDLTGVPVQPAGSFGMLNQPKISVPKSVPPYNLRDLQSIQPTRFQTANLEDTPRKKNELWHSFLWSYDRAAYCADFLEANQFKTMVNSHTATPYHFVTTFLPLDKSAENYGVQSVTRGDDTFQKVKEFFDQHENLKNVKLSIIEIFSSPTNQGQIYACVLDVKDAPQGQKMDWDPLNWNYWYLGVHTDFKFIQPESSHTQEGFMQ